MQRQDDHRCSQKKIRKLFEFVIAKRTDVPVFALNKHIHGGYIRNRLTAPRSIKRRTIDRNAVQKVRDLRSNSNETEDRCDQPVVDKRQGC